MAKGHGRVARQKLSTGIADIGRPRRDPQAWARDRRGRASPASKPPPSTANPLSTFAGGAFGSKQALENAVRSGGLARPESPGGVKANRFAAG